MKKKKVAIYARVSTEHEAQINALENQIQYYDEIMNKHPNWVLYKRYIDEGVTGTSVKKRKNFQKMMEDAYNGKIDLIITREVSRFARNTVDTLQQTRNLKKHGVEVYFTDDNIRTLNDDDGELRLTLMATLAQNESKKTSMRVKAGQMISFKNGVLYGNGNILGYDKKGQEVVVNEEQAKTVKMIYDMYLNGQGLSGICFELERRGRLTAMGKVHWHPTNVSKILKNSFYCGKIVYRKQFTPDYLEQKKIKNNGEVQKIVVDGNHPTIISEEDFLKVQDIMQSKSKIIGNRRYGKKIHTNIYSDKLVCECGSRFKREKWHKTKEGHIQYGFICSKQKTQGSLKKRAKAGMTTTDSCGIKMFAEWKVLMMSEWIFKELLPNSEDLLKRTKELLLKHLSDKDEEDIAKERRIELLSEEIESKKKRLEGLLGLRLDGEITKEEFAIEKSKLNISIKKFSDEISVLEETIKQKKTPEQVVDDLEDFMKTNFNILNGKVSERVVGVYVKKIIVHEDSFEWLLRTKHYDKIVCNVEGKKRSNPNIIELDKVQKAPTDVSHSTGCNQQ